MSLSLTVLLSRIAVVGMSFASLAPAGRAAELTERDLKEIRRIEAALEDGTLPQPPGWWFNHAASEEGQKELEAVGYPTPEAGLAAIAERVGGWAKYKANVAGLLKSKDLVVRGFAAIWLADLGDRQYTPDLLELLQTERPAGPDENFVGSDRAEAAAALGILGAREHVQTIAAYLKDPNPSIRAGAVKGLAWLKEVAYHQNIAALLDDQDSQVATTAILALATLGQKQYADRFVDIAGAEIPENDRAALLALVILKAKDQAPKIARLMADKEWSQRRGLAVETLALLDCREYAPEIAKLLNEDDAFLKSDALVALGVLGEAKYVSEIAVFLKSDDRSLRQAAAWSLIYMESPDYIIQALAVYNPFEISQAGIGIDQPGDIARQIKKRFEASLRRAESAAKNAPKA